MDIERSLTYPFEDRNWLSKLGTGALIGLVPLLNFAWTGYMVGIIRGVMAGAAEPLPTWDDLERKFLDGLLLFAAALVYALPALVVIAVPVGMLISSGILSANANQQDFARWLGGAGGASLAGVLCVLVAYSLVLSVIHPAILVMFAREGTLASCFKLGAMTRLISRNSGPYFTVWGWSILAAIGIGLAAAVLSLALNLIPCAGWIAGLLIGLGSGVYITSVQSHLIGQFAAQAVRGAAAAGAG